MTEKSEMNIDDYYKNTVLLVDEADSTLIDEIANGTIISRPLNSKIQIYKGQNIKIKANDESGKEGVISLGANVCGRGFHIEVENTFTCNYFFLFI